MGVPGMVMLPLATANASDVMPVKADTFIDSIGVNYYVDSGQVGLPGNLTQRRPLRILWLLACGMFAGCSGVIPQTYSIYHDLNAPFGVKFDVPLARGWSLLESYLTRHPWA